MTYHISIVSSCWALKMCCLEYVYVRCRFHHNLHIIDWATLLWLPLCRILTSKCYHCQCWTPSHKILSLARIWYKKGVEYHWLQYGKAFPALFLGFCSCLTHQWYPPYPFLWVELPFKQGYLVAHQSWRDVNVCVRAQRTASLLAPIHHSHVTGSFHGSGA